MGGEWSALGWDTGAMAWSLRATAVKIQDREVQEGHGRCHAHEIEKMEVSENLRSP